MPCRGLTMYCTSAAAGAARVTEDRIYPGGSHYAPWATRERQAAMLAVIPG